MLVENKIGAGRVCMLTVGEYWGHGSLDAFRRELCGRLVAGHRAEPWLSGDASEIDFHVFKCGDTTRVVLLNTDWICDGNVKTATIHAGGMSIPIRMREGRLTHVLPQDGFAIVFETPPSVVDHLAVGDDAAEFTIAASGTVAASLQSKRRPRRIEVDGDEAQIGERLMIDLGPTWNERVARVLF